MVETEKPSFFDRLSSIDAMWVGLGYSLIISILIWVINILFLTDTPLIPDRPGFWYAWQKVSPSAWTKISAWGGYVLHQVVFWAIVYYAQRQNLKYTKGLHKINYIALGANAFFILLHLVQTAIWYDGLAADVPSQTSQWSVILLLVMVLWMENQRRGLFFGKKIGFLTSTGKVIRKYHGLYFAWAIVYTFWFHPMVFTSGHALGFFYMFMLILQGSLFFTRAHVNKYWMIAQEVMVVIHAVVISVMNDDGGWAMFLFGFTGLFVVTQMYGLGLKKWQRYAFFTLYIGAVIGTYSQRGWDLLNEIIRVPAIEYLTLFVLAGITWIGMKGVSWWQGSQKELAGAGD